MSAVKALGLKFLLYKAQADEAAARLSMELLLKEGVGIGDHSTTDYYENLLQAHNLLVDAEDRLESLERNFGVER
jgi:hypothetical protein